MSVTTPRGFTATGVTAGLTAGAALYAVGYTLLAVELGGLTATWTHVTSIQPGLGIVATPVPAAERVAVMTFCCGVDFNVPVCWAMARKRCTESMTSCGWARKALPRFSTHGAFSPINASREGKATSDFTLGSQG